MATKKKAEAKDPSAAVNELLTTVASKEKNVARSLAGPASAAALARLEALGAPVALRRLYERHDGSTAAFFGPYRLLPIEELAAMRDAQLARLASDERWQREGRWREGLVPFLADEDGQLWAFEREGAVHAFDHEAGLERALASSDVWVALAAKLAKKKLLGEDAWAEQRDEVEALLDEARAIGRALLPRARRDALETELAYAASAADRLARLKPLTAEHPDDDWLWARLADAASSVGDWAVAASAAAQAIRLAGRDMKTASVPTCVLALHRLGDDEGSLVALEAGLGRARAGEPPLGLLPRAEQRAIGASDADDAWWRRALRSIRRAVPNDVAACLELARVSDDPSERRATLDALIARVDALVMPSPSDLDARLTARCWLERERLAAVAPEERLRAWTAFAETATTPQMHGSSAVEGAWVEAIATAGQLGLWTEAEMLASRLIEISPDLRRPWLAHHRARALHHLGKDDEAFAVIVEALSSPLVPLYSDRCLEVIPDHLALESSVELPKVARAFLSRCYAWVAEHELGLIAAWDRAIETSEGEARRALWARVAEVARTEAPRVDESGAPYYAADQIAGLTRLGTRAEAEIG